MALVKCNASFSYQTAGGPRTIAVGELLDESDPAVSARRDFFTPTAAQQLVTAAELDPTAAASLAADPAFTGTYAEKLGAWAAGTYGAGVAVTKDGTSYVSLIDGNTATPGTDVTKWQPLATAPRVKTHVQRLEMWDFGISTSTSQGHYDFLVVGDPADPIGNSAENGFTGASAEHGFNLHVQGFMQVDNSMSIFARYQPYIVIGRMGIDNRHPDKRPAGYGEELALGVVGVNGDYFTGTLPGDCAIRAYGVGQGTSLRTRRLHLGSNDGTTTAGPLDATMIIDATSIELRRTPNWAGASMTAASAALPSTPDGYAYVKIGGHLAKIPCYYIPVASDAFARADGSLDGSTTESGSLTWTKTAINGSSPVPTASIVSNQVRLTSTGSGQCLALVDSGFPDQDATVTVATIEEGTGLIVKYTDANNFMIFGKTSGAASYTLTRRFLGTYQAVGVSTGVTPASGDVLRVVATGNSYTCYVNGVQVISYTDTANLAGTKVGMQSNGATGANRFDNFALMRA